MLYENIMTGVNPEGRVAVFEDYPPYLFLIRTNVKQPIVIEETTLENGLAAIEFRVRQFGSIALDAAIVDGNLTPGDKTNSDGAKIIAAIREAPNGEDVFVINSTNTETDIPGQDIRYPKYDFIGMAAAINGYIMTREKP